MLRSLVATALALAAAVSTNAQAQPAESNPWTELERRPGTGEVCLVCRTPVEGDDVVEVRYQGRVFHVSAAHFPEFEADPDRYFARIQARSALFDEKAVPVATASNGWLYVGLYVLIGLVFAALCGHVALQRGLKPIPWFFAGLVGNLAALAVLLFTKAEAQVAYVEGVPGGLAKIPTTHSPVECPNCHNFNHPAAENCIHCGYKLDPKIESEAQRV